MSVDDKTKLLDIYKNDLEMRRLILENEKLTQQNGAFIYIHYIIPTVIITLAAGKLLTVFA